jgi:two-component system cell cycle sensor histidine kinase/response regulator CckA
MTNTLPTGISERMPSCFGAAKTVLLVDDEPMVRSLLMCLLREQGFSILEATSGYEAIALAEAHYDPIHLLITDLAMPTIRGSELAERIATLHQETQVLFLSGCSESSLHGQQAKRGTAFLRKPFRRDALLHTVFQLVNKTQERTHARSFYS